MKKLLLLLLFAGLLNTGSVFGWGREGHETIAKIAERNLTKKAKKRIEKYRLLRQVDGRIPPYPRV